MAGETVKSTALTNAEAGRKTSGKLARGTVYQARDHKALLATETEAADVILLHIDIPSNAVITRIAIYNDDLDANACCPTLALDVGLYAAQNFIGLVSSTATSYDANDVIDADAYVDGATDGQAATTKFTDLAFDATTYGPDDALKEAWEVGGFDEDPHTMFRVGIVAATAAATGAAGDIAILVEYVS